MTGSENDVVLGRHLDSLTAEISKKFATMSVGGGSGIVLPTVANPVDGGFWLDVSGDVPVPKFYYGGETYVFDGASKGPRLPDDIVAYLPFGSSPTLDLCGNTWTAVGTPTIVDDANVPSGKSLYLNGDSYLENTTVSDSVGASPWTIDFWLNGRENTNSKLFGTFNNVYATHENCTTTNEKNFCIMLSRCGARPSYELDLFYNGTEFKNLSTPAGTRHHHALTYDGTDIRFFLDGVLIGSFTHNVILGRRFRIGDATFNNTGTHFVGSFDHFRIFKTALWTSDFTPPYLESDYYV